MGKMYLDDFSYNGAKLSDIGCMTCFFDSSSEDDNEFINTSIESERASHNITDFIVSSATDSYEFDITLAKKNDTGSNGVYFTKAECRQIMKWFNVTKRFLPFKILDEEYDGLYYNCAVKKIGYKVIGGNIAGVDITFVCDSFCGWVDKEISYAITDILTTELIIDTDETEYPVYPVIEFTKTASAGEFFITNKTTDVTTAFSTVPQNNTISIDCDKNVLTSRYTESTNLYLSFNKKFLYLQDGANELEISGTGTLKMKYKEARKVI